MADAGLIRNTQDGLKRRSDRTQCGVRSVTYNFRSFGLPLDMYLVNHFDVLPAFPLISM